MLDLFDFENGLFYSCSARESANLAITLPERFAFLDSAPEEQRQAALSHLAVMVVRAIRLEIERIKMNNETIRVATVDFV